VSACIGDNVAVTLYDSTPGVRPDRHLKDRELGWFDFDPGPFVAFIREATEGRDDELAARIATIRRAAWACPSFLVFAAPRRIVPPNPVVESETEELVFDLDGNGNPVSVEFTTHECDVS
jgi:hypothetical protein